MLKARILSLIQQGESINVEFKECKESLTKNIYETICAFLNWEGGELLVGVSDNGKVIGVDDVSQLKKDIATTLNNPQKINPSVYLAVDDAEISGKTVLYVYVPKSSQVHKCNGRIFIRNEDGDFDITNNNTLVTNLYLNKQTAYTENKIYPYCKLSDLREDLIGRARTMAGHGHPWEKLSNLELLKSVKLYAKDYQTGQEGFTLACILLFGKDETIISVLPHHKTDLILRRENLDRYDDRDDVRTNLIESYDRIMAFARKHLPDPFYLEGTQRVSVRDKIFREVASNILIHREYSSAFPAKIIIEKNRIYSENSNKPHHRGVIDINNFSPYPKNPVIARVFEEIGFADELGSGIRNLKKYVKIYSNSAPQLIEEDVFKIIVPLGEGVEKDLVNDLEKDLVNDLDLTENQKQILIEIEKHIHITQKELSRRIGITEKNIRNNILILKQKGLLKRVGPDKGGHWEIIKRKD